MKIVYVSIRETPILGLDVHTLCFIVGAIMDSGAAAAVHPEAAGVSEDSGVFMGVIEKAGGGGVEVDFEAK